MKVNLRYLLIVYTYDVIKITEIEFTRFFLGHSKHILQSCIAIFAEVIIFSSNTIKVDKMNFLFLSDFLACGAELEKKRNIVTQFDEIINTLHDKFVNRLLSYAIFLLPRI